MTFEISISPKKTRKYNLLEEVYVPNMVGSQGNLGSETEVINRAYGFLKKGITDSIDLIHGGQKVGHTL